MIKTISFIILFSLSVAASEKPNIVFILVDDMGWTGLSSLSDPSDERSKSDFYQTPNIDALAQSGMVFSNAYSPAPMCTPSRASILTGMSPAQLHVTTPGKSQKVNNSQRIIPPEHKNYLDRKEVTIAEILRQEGYKTAHFGKWHLLGNGPGEHGFDQHDGDTKNGGPGEYKAPNPKDINGVTQRTIDFMRKSTATQKPFYVQLSHYAVHSPSIATDSSKAYFDQLPAGKNHKNVDYAAMTRDLDLSINKVLQELKNLKIKDNTYIVLMSDNGAATRQSPRENYPLSGGKASLWEGGIRVPLIICGPGIKKGSCRENVIGYDLFPTFLKWSQSKKRLSRKIEGLPLNYLLTKKRSTLPPRSLVFHFPHYGKGPKQKPQSAIINGANKMIYFWEDQTAKIYNLKKDLSESEELGDKQLSKKLTQKLLAHLQKINAQLPKKNPSYDPQASQKKAKKPFLKRYDKNNDGEVDRAEFDGPSRRWQKLDSNKDGIIKGDEIPAGPKH